MASINSPQELIDQFWEGIVSHSTNPTITTTLPKSIFAEGFQDQVPQNPGVAENVMAGYERAAEKCKAKVDKISNECRLYNQKYTDPTFDLSSWNYCLRPLSTDVLPEKGRKGEEEFVNLPPRMILLVDDKAPINLTQLITPQAEKNDEPGEESLGQPPHSVKRVRQIFDKPEFFVDGATADDVRQGDVGDCWFISALSALCCMEAKELGNLVERVCVKRDEAAGVYGFVFYRDGEWRSEIVDDKLFLTAPDYDRMAYTTDMNYLLKYIKEKDRAEQYRRIVQSNSDALFFARSAHKSETWVPLIEKAYAKAHVDFEAIDGGLISDGIEDLTGGLATFFRSEDIVDLDRFWDEGLAQVNKSLLWGCGTYTVNEKDKRGIEGGHAYTILEAETIPDGTRLVKVRNPWGKNEWEGDWSDRSTKWTDELKSFLKHEDKDDGIFWISYDDLLRNYPFLHRTRIFDASWTVAQSWTNFTVPLLSSDTYESTFKVTLSKAATTAIVLSQLDERYFRGLEGQYNWGLSFRLHKLNEDDYLYRCHNRHFSDRSINLEVDLEAGVYEVRLQITSERYPDRPKIEDVVRINWKDSRKKLLQICRSYDLAHAKVAVPELQPKAMEAKETAKEPTAEKDDVDVSSEDKLEDLASSGVRVSKPESRSGGAEAESKIDSNHGEAVGEDKSDINEGDSGSRPEEEAKESTVREKSAFSTKPKASEGRHLLEDFKPESPVVVVHQDHKSDSDTTSTEPEMIESPDLKPEAERDGKDSMTKTDVETKDSKPEYVTSRTVQKQAAGAELPTSSPPSAAQPKSSSQRAARGIATDVQSPAIQDSQAADMKKDDDLPSPDKDKDIKKDDDTPEPEKDKDIEKEEKEDKGDDKEEDEPFNSVCTVGLRVYCKDAEARIEIIHPSTALLRNKQFTSSREKSLDVDDPAKS